MAKGNESFEVRILQKLDALDYKLDGLSSLEMRLPALTGLKRVPAPLAKDVGENLNARQCHPVRIRLNRRNCHRIAMVSKDENATLDIVWADNEGVQTTDTLRTAGTHTACRCDMVGVQVHAKDGDVVFTVVECETGD